MWLEWMERTLERRQVPRRLAAREERLAPVEYDYAGDLPRFILPPPAPAEDCCCEEGCI
jgi:hypothetical protein